MANSEEYTLVWAGVARDLATHEVRQVEIGSHPLVVRARSHGLTVFWDTFGTDPVEGETYKLLLGTQMSVLGYKEGVTGLELDPQVFNEQLHAVAEKLALAGISGDPALHILLHIVY